MRVTVLGSGQDGALPQVAADHDLDHAAREGSIPERTGPSLVVEVADRTLLCDVSPDFRVQWWNRTALPDAIALTHAHVGHYAGLVHFGKEVAAASPVELFATEPMLAFLAANAPWSALIDDRRLVASAEPVWAGHAIELIPVPHRLEFSDTVAVSIGQRLLWLPDVDSWEQWPEAVEVVEGHEVAFLDATFWSQNEIPGRSIDEIPHPLVPETIKTFAGVKTRIVLTHLNHTNPLCDPASAENRIVHEAGFEVAFDGMTMDL
jgi:pyrroloquinoline quinone biosynthesis protein B